MYLRLHGSPHMYYSSYSLSYLNELSRRLTIPNGEDRWCIFDNTAAGAAWHDAPLLQHLLSNAPFKAQSAAHSPMMRAACT